MNKRDRTELFDALAELRRRYPEWRLGQLIANIADWDDKNVWDIEDEQLLAAAEEHLHEVAQAKKYLASVPDIAPPEQDRIDDN